MFLFHPFLLRICASHLQVINYVIPCYVILCHVISLHYVIVCDVIMSYYRNQYYVDGGLSDNLPRENTTIAVQPWQGEADISPKDGKFSYSELNFTFANCNIDVTPDNILRFSQMLFPSTVEGKSTVRGTVHRPDCPGSDSSDNFLQCAVISVVRDFMIATIF